MSTEAAAFRLRLALDLFATGEAMMRQRLRRLHSGWTEAEIERRVVQWLHERPGAEAGDAEGRTAASSKRLG
jgi:flagellar biosynthesis chaperone FliJ